MKLSSADKLILCEALLMFIKKAWEDFATMANHPDTLPSKRIELLNHNKRLGDLLVRLIGKPRAEKQIRELLESLDGTDTGRESEERSKEVIKE